MQLFFFFVCYATGLFVLCRVWGRSPLDAAQVLLWVEGAVESIETCLGVLGKGVVVTTGMEELFARLYATLPVSVGTSANVPGTFPWTKDGAGTLVGRTAATMDAIPATVPVATYFLLLASL